MWLKNDTAKNQIKKRMTVKKFECDKKKDWIDIDDSDSTRWWRCPTFSHYIVRDSLLFLNTPTFPNE